MSGEPSTAGTVHGAAVNLLGLLGKLARPLFMVVATRLYGPAALGLFAIAWALIETARQFSSSGFADAVVMFVSRELGVAGPDDRGVYRAIASALWLVLGVGALVVAGTYLFEAPLGGLFPDVADIGPVLRIVVWGVPTMAVAELLVAATRAQLVMRWYALLGTFAPLALLVFAVVIAPYERSVVGLAWAYLGSSIATALASVWAFSRHFRLGGLLAAMVRPRWHGGLVGFALPQNLNMTFNYFATNVDVIMLGAYDVRPALIGFYKAGAELVRGLQSIKVAFGSSFGPVIARFHGAGRTGELTAMYLRLSRLATLAVMPLILAVLALRAELLLAFHASYTYDTSFMLALAAVPLLACATGLAANLIVMTGHVRWNLITSCVGTALNLGLNALAIPRYGLLGAAGATLAASVVVNLLQIAQVRMLLDLRTQLRPLAKPFAAFGVAGLVLAVLDAVVAAGPARFAAAAAVLVVYVGTLLALGLDPEDRAALRRGRSRS